MGILRDFEKRLEGAVEGFFARAFRSGLQPVELAKALQRYAANYQQVGLKGVSVPNVYRLTLSPDDYERFSGFQDSLRHELADVLRRTAAERGWQLMGPVRIDLRSDESVKVGTYELRGKTEALSAQEQPRQDRPAPARAPQHRPPQQAAAATPVGHTAVMPEATSRARLRVLSGLGSQEFTLSGSGVLGRTSECDVTLDEASVSRRHARLSRSDGRWTIEDLGSTNGVRVNGSPVGRASLSDGDELELGSVRLSFSVEA